MPDLFRRRLLQAGGLAAALAAGASLPAGAQVAAVTRDAELHVHPDGDDAADGQSWNTAKRTVLAAYDALPDSGGTIRFANGSEVGGEVAGQGLWIVGPFDPHFNDPLPGWRRAKRLNLIGDGIGTHTANGPMPRSWLRGGSGTDRDKPTIWLAGVHGPWRLENIHVQYPACGIRLGVASDLSSRSVNTSGMVWRNCGGDLNQIAGNGPFLDVGYLYWAWFDWCTFGGNSAEPVDSDLRAGALVDPEGGAASGLVYFRDSVFNGGGIRYRSGGTSWSLYVKRCIEEGSGAELPPLVDILSGDGFGGAVIEDVAVADAPAAATVRIAPNVPPEVVLVSSVDSPANVAGPCTVMTTERSAGWQNRSTTMAREGQIGLSHSRRLEGVHDSARRTFAPVAVRRPNLAPHDLSAWTSGADEALTSGHSAPDGTDGAVRLATAADGLREVTVYRQGRTISEGDWVVAGVWSRGDTRDPVTSIVAVAGVSGAFGADSWFTFGGPFRGDGEWRWSHAVRRVETSGAGELILSVRCTQDQPGTFYAPVLLHIPAGAMTDNEVHELAQHLQPWPDGAPVGAATLLGGQKLLAPAGIGVGNHQPATTPGTVTDKVQVFDAQGESLGWVAVYDDIT